MPEDKGLEVGDKVYSEDGEFLFEIINITQVAVVRYNNGYGVGTTPMTVEMIERFSGKGIFRISKVKK